MMGLKIVIRMVEGELKTKLEKQISEFLEALKDKTDNLESKATETEAALEVEGFETYTKFRDIVIECDSFAEIIQRRLDSIPEENRGSLQNKLDELMIQELTLATSASLKFLNLLSKKKLPLGSNEVLIRELQELEGIRERLASKQYTGKVPESTIADQGKVEAILKSVIEIAPSLLHFDKDHYNEEYS